MMDYLTLKHLHMGCAALSGSLFLLRGSWMLSGSALLERRWVKTAPHLIDTVLLTSAIALASWSGQYPIAQAWLSAKVIALLVYIVLGTIALKRGRTKTVRAIAFVGALAVFLYIGAVAVSKNALPFFS
jgi:uncharacterized membrane protein SirB2